MNPDANFYWLVGLLEGEGSFMAASPSRPNEPRVEVEMKDYDVMARAAALLGASVITRRRPRNGEIMTIYRVRIAGKRAVRLMRSLRPFLCARRMQQIDRAIESFTPKTLRQAIETSKPYVLNTVCADPMCARTAAPASLWCEAHRPADPVSLAA